MYDPTDITIAHASRLVKYMLCDLVIAKYFFDNLIGDNNFDVIDALSKQFPEAYTKAISLYVEDLNAKSQIDRSQLQLKLKRIAKKLEELEPNY
jgi:hypothetical protein